MDEGLLGRRFLGRGLVGMKVIGIKVAWEEMNADNYVKVSLKCDM